MLAEWDATVLDVNRGDREDSPENFVTTTRGLPPLRKANFELWRKTAVALECCCVQDPLRSGLDGLASGCEVLSAPCASHARSPAKRSFGLWACMSLKGESLNPNELWSFTFAAAFRSPKGANARVLEKYALPDFVELQILFYTGRLQYLRKRLVSGSEFRGVPWSSRLRMWSRARGSLGCWWMELKHKFSAGESYDVKLVAECLLVERFDIETYSDFSAK